MRVVAQCVRRPSESISKSCRDVWARPKLRNESALYYYRNYLRANPLKMLAARAFFQIVRLEIWFCGSVLKMKW